MSRSRYTDFEITLWPQYRWNRRVHFFFKLSSSYPWWEDEPYWMSKSQWANVDITCEHDNEQRVECILIKQLFCDVIKWLDVSWYYSTSAQVFSYKSYDKNCNMMHRIPVLFVSMEKKDDPLLQRLSQQFIRSADLLKVPIEDREQNLTKSILARVCTLNVYG